MTMTGRFVDHGVRILAAVALLAVMSSPIRPSRASHTTPSPDDLPRNFVIFNNGHSGQFAMSARPSLREAHALQSAIEDELDADIEDELTVKSPPASVSFRRTPLSLPRALLRTGPLRCRTRGPTAPLLSPSPRPASSVSRGAIHWGGCPSVPIGPVMGPAIAPMDCAPSRPTPRCPHDRPRRGASRQCSQIRVNRRVLARFFRSLHEGTSPMEISRPNCGC